MCRAPSFWFCPLLLIIASGCGKKDDPLQISVGVAKPPDQAKVARVAALFDESASVFNSCAAKISQVADKDSAISASEELTKSAKRLREMAQELRSLGKLTKAEDDQLQTRRVPKEDPKSIETAAANFGKATKELTPKYKDLPPDAVKALGEAFEDFSKASMEFSKASRAMAP
jgi:hypothetical protein